MKGVDVASFQGTIDFDVLKGEVDFAIAKATEGVGFKDPTFDRNWTEAGRVGLRRGAYHFARPDLGNSAQDEARWFLANIGPVNPSDILALDYEVAWDGDVVGWCKAWLDFVRQSTIAPHVYLNLSLQWTNYQLGRPIEDLVKKHDWSPVVTAGYPLWLAFYDESPTALPPTQWPRVAIKQWTSSGTLAGIQSPRVDLNTEFGGIDMNLPQYQGQTSETVALKVGEVGLLEGSWIWPNGTRRAQTEKVVFRAPGRRAYAMYPKVDPDADETRELSADPALFIIDVSL